MPTIDFLWNEWDDNLFQETDDHGVVTSYVTMPGKHGEVLYDQQGNRFTYYHNDGNGSTHKLTGANQAVTKTYIFTGFGELIASPGLGSTPFAYKGAAGYYTNPVTNDIYVRARSYEPTTGRWLSKDPLGFVDGPNLYGAYFVPGEQDPSGTILVTAGGHKGQVSCGKTAGASWKFVLSKKYLESGWIVQKVTVECAIGPCRFEEYRNESGQICKSCTCEIPEPDRFEYWEAWRIEKKELVSREWGTKDKLYHDTAAVFAIPDTCGHFTQDGDIRFFLDSEIAKHGNSPASWPRGRAYYRHDSRCATSTYKLRSTGEEPAWWWSSEESGDRYFVLDWNCCKCKKDTHVRDRSHPPYER